DVLEEEEGSSLTVASLYEECDFLGRVSVNDAAKLRGFATLAYEATLIGYDSDRDAFDARVAGQDFGGIVGLELVEIAAVYQACDHLAHIVGMPVVGRNKII